MQKIHVEIRNNFLNWLWRKKQDWAALTSVPPSVQCAPFSTVCPGSPPLAQRWALLLPTLHYCLKSLGVPYSPRLGPGLRYDSFYQICHSGHFNSLGSLLSLTGFIKYMDFPSCSQFWWGITAWGMRSGYPQGGLLGWATHDGQAEVYISWSKREIWKAGKIKEMGKIVLFSPLMDVY